MQRSSLLSLLVSLVAVALLSFASAQVRLEPTAGAFPCDDEEEFTDEPCEVGIHIRSDDQGLVIVLVEAGTGSIPDARTGFAGEMPTATLGEVDAYAAMRLCQEISQTAGGVTLIHEEIGMMALADAYRAALEEAGLTFANQSTTGSCRTLTFTRPNGQTIRLALAYRAGDVQAVQAYLGR
jgi:hypothetical protein